MSESNRESNFAKLGSYIVTSHDHTVVKGMIGTYEARDEAATKLFGSLYGVSLEFTCLVDDAVGSSTVTNETRRSAIREALHTIELYGLIGVRIKAAEPAKAYAEAVAA